MENNLDLKQWPLSKCSLLLLCTTKYFHYNGSIVMGSNGDFYHHIRYHTFPIVLSYFTFKRLYIPKIKSISHKDSPFATTFDTLLNFPIYSLAETKILRSKKYIVVFHVFVRFIRTKLHRKTKTRRPPWNRHLHFTIHSNFTIYLAL